ncbi:hypothetical protein SORBI_3010G144250 [Sorghum bicolor]|uniref:Uncharacterized protein n=1 Tax=Sorghum bicolor TaxID=4558 RepID=A0A1W0VT53_SORBI|nr:hypothetical protein SORBI_3010G144250 [Sorghum bicolor]
MAAPAEARLTPPQRRPSAAAYQRGVQVQVAPWLPRLVRSSRATIPIQAGNQKIRKIQRPPRFLLLADHDTDVSSRAAETP